MNNFIIEFIFFTILNLFSFFLIFLKFKNRLQNSLKKKSIMKKQIQNLEIKLFHQNNHLKNLQLQLIEIKNNNHMLLVELEKNFYKAKEEAIKSENLIIESLIDIKQTENFFWKDKVKNLVLNILEI